MGLNKRKDGWYVEFSVLDDGKALTLARGTPGAKLKRWKTGAMNKTVAKQQEAMIKTDLMKGVIKSDQSKDLFNFNELAKFYLSHPSVLRQKTLKWKKVTIENQFLPYFKKNVIGRITPSMIEGFREARLRDLGYQGTTLKPATMNRQLALLKHMFSMAIREGWLDRNPVSLVKFQRENNARDRVLDPEEFTKLQQHSAPHLQAMNLCAYQTGMRLGEILHLTWDRVDFKMGFIQLRAEDTKTDDARIIPLTLELTGLLKNLHKVRYLQEAHVFLVKGQSVSSIQTAFNGACGRADIQNFRFHDFRHTAVTNMRRAGIDHLTIMRITGHKTMDVFKRYNSFHQEDLREAASRFNTYLTLAHSPLLTDAPKLLKNKACARSSIG